MYFKKIIKMWEIVVVPRCKSRGSEDGGWAIKIFHKWQINREVKVPVLDSGGTFKDYGYLYKVQSLSTDLANMDANALNYWLSKFVQEVVDSEGKVYPGRTLYGIICGIRRHFEETVGSEALNALDALDKR